MIVATKKTLTSIFFVPTLKIGREKLTKHGYINGYQQDASYHLNCDNCIYVLFKPENMESFRDFLEDEYERTKSIIDDYDYEGGFVVLIYKLNPRFKKDFELVKAGKYSKTSLEFQSMFPKVVKINTNGIQRDELSLQYRVFNKTNDLKQYWEEKIGVLFDDKMEVWYGWEEEDEILDIDKIKENA